MDIHELLIRVKNGSMSVDEAVSRLKTLPFEDIGYAKVDHHRSIRTGFPEVIFCQGKTVDQVVGIVKSMMDREADIILGTKVSEQQYEAVAKLYPDIEYNKAARVFKIVSKPVEPLHKEVAVVSAGTADIPVAEEAAVTAQSFGLAVNRIYDVGVAGIHRLFARLDDILKADVVIAVAGMEGALASVLGGLVDKPVIAVPTSVGYGSNFNGLAALLSMLNSCAAGVGVVNIDNGFGAGYLAGKICRGMSKR